MYLKAPLRLGLGVLAAHMGGEGREGVLSAADATAAQGEHSFHAISQPGPRLRS